MNTPNASAPRIDPTYWEYIGLDRLLRLQGGIEGGEVESPDELHFIVIHQAIELMFKLVLREMRETRSALSRPLDESAMPAVAAHLARMNEALGVAASHFAFMESLGTQGFLSFRDKLGTSSGAQSFQMREMEELLGLPRAERERVLRRLRAELPNPDAVRGFEAFVLDPLAAISKRILGQIEHKQGLGADDASDRFVADYLRAAQDDIAERGTLRDSLKAWAFRAPICGSTPDADPDRDQETVRGFVADYLERGGRYGWTEVQVEGAREFLQGSSESPITWSTERVRAAMLFIEVYSDLPLLAWPRLLLERLVEMESRMVAFRNGHARMVERVIGDRPGTGGSAGIRYLDLTRDARVFPELAQIRGMLLPRGDRWEFPGIERYDFVEGNRLMMG